MVLVTGGTGFIGAYIIKNLVEKGYPVRALRRSTKVPFFIDASIYEKVEWVAGDVLDVSALDDAMKDVTHVIHSAAVVSFHSSQQKQMYKVNIDGTTNVVNVAIHNKVKRFLHVSSVAAIGRTNNNEIVKEEKSWEEAKENTHYAITKYHAEIQVWRGFAEGLEGVIINPSTVLGYGDWHQSSCAIFKNVYNEFPWYTKGVNGFVGVEDVAEVAVQLLFSGINEKRFIVSADNWSFEQIFHTIAREFNKKPAHRLATPLLAQLAWRLERVKSLLSGNKPLLTRETANVAQTTTLFNNEAILKALPGFTFMPLDAVIKRSCEKYLQAVQEGKLSP